MKSHNPATLPEPRGPVPLLRVAGKAFDCGLQLGELWRPALRDRAESPGSGTVSILGTKAIAGLFERHAPSVIDLHRGMAKGAGIPEDRLNSLFPAGAGLADGCTSFAVQPAATRDGKPLSGQTKDTGAERIEQYQVLALRIENGLHLLTLTYPGWLFGHGFAAGGCAIFRNSISCGNPGGKLPYDVWGLLAQTCPTVDDVRKLTLDHGVMEGFHCVIADERGGILGIEAGRTGYAFLGPENGLYTHTNHVMSGPPLSDIEDPPIYGIDGSEHRQKRLLELLARKAGQITGRSAFSALADHTNYPNSICSNDRANGGLTTAAVVAEPLSRLMHVCRGLPCNNPPVTYHLDPETAL
jgi:isopenicillin-N N-acyltransferase-like protein